MTDWVLMNVTEPSEIRLLEKYLRFPILEPDLAPGCAIRTVHLSCGNRVQVANKIPQMRRLFQSRNIMIVIWKDGPGLQCGGMFHAEQK